MITKEKIIEIWIQIDKTTKALVLFIIPLYGFVNFWHPSNEDNSKFEYFVVILKDYIYELSLVIMLMLMLRFVVPNISMSNLFIEIKKANSKNGSFIQLFSLLIVFIFPLWIMYESFYLVKHSKRHIGNFNSIYRVYLLRGYAESMQNRDFENATEYLEKHTKNYKKSTKEITHLSNFLIYRIHQNDFFLKDVKNEKRLDKKKLVNILSAYSYYPNKKTRKLLQEQEELIEQYYDLARKFYIAFEKGESENCINIYNKINFFYLTII